MNKIQILGFITIVVGFIVSGIGTFYGSDWSVNNFLGVDGGPYSSTVGIVGLVIVCGGFYLLGYEEKRAS